MTSSVVGIVGNGGKSVTYKLQPKAGHRDWFCLCCEGNGDKLCLRWEVASCSAVRDLTLHYSLGD